jgi:hypothetical protein
VATVNNGVVSAKAAGTAKITVTTADGGKTASCPVTVSLTPVAVSGVSLNKTTASISVGATETLTAAITPANATNQTLRWESSNTDVATVNNAGLVSAKAVGTANITVTTADGNKTAICAVTVTVAVSGVSLNKNATVILVDATETLIATVAPSNATNQTLTWASDNESVATVNDGVVTALAAGTANITVTTDDGGFTASCTVTVDPITYTISLSQSETYTFPAAAVGYATAPEPKSVTVNNTGNQPTGTLRVGLSGDDSGSFTLSTPSISSIGLSGTADFTVVPKPALAVGTYTAEVTVSSLSYPSISANFTVSFMVYTMGQGISVIFSDPGSRAFSEQTFTLSGTSSQTVSLAGSWVSREWRVDGAVKGTGTDITVNAVDYGPGNHTLKVTVKDGAGKYWSKTLQFTKE